jgi:hypothetical protein
MGGKSSCCRPSPVASRRSTVVCGQVGLTTACVHGVLQEMDMDDAESTTASASPQYQCVTVVPGAGAGPGEIDGSKPERFQHMEAAHLAKWVTCTRVGPSASSPGADR